MSGLDSKLTPGLAGAVEKVDLADVVWPSPTLLEQKLSEWGSLAEVDVVDLGHSREGRTIRAAVIGAGPRTLLAWGFPHPDEPIGAQTLVELGELAMAGELTELADWRLVLVLCADPDNASRNTWLGRPGGFREFGVGTWRPQHLGLEVDYGFPIDWGPFYQPSDYAGRCRSITECRYMCTGIEACARSGLPWSPLPESKALLTAMERFRPQLVASMHNTHTAGDYTFLLHRERPEVMDALTSIPDLVGSMRHLGEPIDRGVRWRRSDPDLIRERTIEYHRRRLERHPRFNPDPEMAYAGNASAASIIGVTLPDAQFVCPETAVYRHRAFADTSPTVIEFDYKVGVEKRRRGTYEVTRFKDIDGEWVICNQVRVEGAASGPGEEYRRPATRGALGVSAVRRKRRVLAAADEVWEEVRSLADLKPHPYLDERARTSAPGAFVSDRSMLIFRTRPDYARVASAAQAATLNWAWPAHTVTLLGNFRNFLASQDQARPEIAEADRRIAEIQDGELAAMPPELREHADHGAAVRSQLARVLLLMLARSSDG